MWNYVLLLAIVAGSYACPEPCECRRITDREDLAILIEASCEGVAPRLVDLSSNTARLKLEHGNESSVSEVVESLVNVTGVFPYLDELFLVNCSVKRLNVSWEGLDHVRVLNLSGNSFVRLEDVGLSSERVNFTGLRVFDASWNLLRDLSAGTFGSAWNLGKLILRHNNLSSIGEKAFLGLGKLEILDLADNRLGFIPKDALVPLSSLQKLDLGGNQLRVLGAGWFESLGKLRELDVSRNGLVRAASGALQTLSGLSVLRLSENPLRERDVSLLLGSGRRLETVDASRTGLVRVPAALTRSVRALRLAGNKLTAIRGGDLDSYPLIRLLDMSDNRVSDVEEDALGRLEVLAELNLSGNLLTEMPRSLPSSLLSLNLDGNLVRILRWGDLRGLENLKTLSLRNNAIKEIQEGSLGQVPGLESLDISDNPVKELPANTLGGPRGLQSLRMSGLTSLQWNRKAQSDMAFPVPGPERLVSLDVSRSPVLAQQLLSDSAALSACKSLLRLDLEKTNLTTLRADLAYVLPQLRFLGLGENRWKCDEDIFWLGGWIRLHEEIRPRARCWEPSSLNGTLIDELPSPPQPTTSPTPKSRPTSTSTSTSRRTTTISTTTVEVTKNLTQHPSTPGTEFEAPVGGSRSGEVTESKAVPTSTNLVVPSASSVPRLSSISENERSISGSGGNSLQAPLNGITLNVTLVKKYNDSEEFRGTTTTSVAVAASVVLDRRSGGEKSSNESRRGSKSERVSSTTTRIERVDRRQSNVISSERRVDVISKKESATKSKLVSSKEYVEDQSIDIDENYPRDEGAPSVKETKTPQHRIEIAAAEELRVATDETATESGSRIGQPLSAGAHPGMLVLVGAALGAVAALSVLLSRRANARKRRRDCYQRHENIEVHTLTPITELW